MQKDELLEQMLDSNIEEITLPLRQSMCYYRCAIMEIETKFKVLNEQFSLYYDRNPIESIHTRIKSEASILRKLKRKGLDISVEAMEDHIYDIAGIRVISSFQDDIYHLADLLLKQDDIRLVEKKDYIQNPKENGYRSLHLIVEIPIFLANEKKWIKAEVQFRTIAMDFWASLEHKLRYKKDLSQERLHEIDDELKQCANICAHLDKKMGDIKNSEVKHTLF